MGSEFPLVSGRASLDNMVRVELLAACAKLHGKESDPRVESQSVSLLPIQRADPNPMQLRLHGYLQTETSLLRTA